MHQKQIELLKLLIEATRSGRVVWQRDDIQSHNAKLADMRFALRFKHPLLAGDEGSDADAVEVTIDRTVGTFYSGSEGFDLVGDILSAAYPEIRAHNQMVATQLQQTIEKLRKHKA